MKDKNDPDAVNMRESYGSSQAIPLLSYMLRAEQRNAAQAARFASGIPGQRFAKLASKEIRHKL